jgi:hypothetical protein
MGKGGSTTIQAPAAPNYQESMKSILQAQVEMAPQVYAREAEYQPKYQQLQNQMQAAEAQAQIGLYKQLQPEYSQLEDAYKKSTQQNQLQGLQERAPGYIQAFQQAQGTAGINKALQGYAENNLGQQMQQNFQISPEEQRGIDQQTMAGYAAQGTALGGQSNLASVLNRYQYTQQRQQQALQNASAIGGYLSQQSQPALASFYQQPMYASSFGGQAIGNALSSQQQAGPQLFNPESQTGMGSIYGAYNAQMGLAGAQAQANAAKSAGKSGMFGSIIGGIGGGLVKGLFCWVAREVYGEQNPAWLLFRNWMLNDAPRWLLGMYITFGEQFANFISDKPKLKNIIRKWMDSKISA